MRIICSTLMTETAQVERSWRERLLTWPWRPLQRHRHVQVPRMDYLINDGPGGQFIVCHPAAYDRLRRAVDQ